MPHGITWHRERKLTTRTPANWIQRAVQAIQPNCGCTMQQPKPIQTLFALIHTVHTCKGLGSVPGALFLPPALGHDKAERLSSQASKLDGGLRSKCLSSANVVHWVQKAEMVGHCSLERLRSQRRFKLLSCSRPNDLMMPHGYSSPAKANSNTIVSSSTVERAAGIHQLL